MAVVRYPRQELSEHAVGGRRVDDAEDRAETDRADGNGADLAERDHRRPADELLGGVGQPEPLSKLA